MKLEVIHVIKGPKKSVGVLMSMEMYERVKKQAERKDKTMPGYIRQVLRLYLWHVENTPEALAEEWEIT